MTKGRQADSARRRQRVIAVLDKAAADGTEISVSAIARAAAVDRTFLYRHRDLLAKIHALEAAPPPAGEGAGPAVTRASLQADLLAAHERAARLNARVQQLEKRLSEALGEHAWRESGLGSPADIDALGQQITHLEQQVIDLRIQMEERDEELAAARAANRELMAQLNATARRLHAFPRCQPPGAADHAGSPRRLRVPVKPAPHPRHRLRTSTPVPRSVSTRTFSSSSRSALSAKSTTITWPSAVTARPSTMATLTTRPACSASRIFRAFLLVVFFSKGNAGFLPRLRYPLNRCTRLTAAWPMYSATTSDQSLIVNR
jgi:hypothetical protein